MIPQLLYLILGLVVVWISSGVVIDSSIRIAKALRMSELFIGLTIVSIGTSLPEIAMHVISSIDILKGMNTSGIAVGTNIGSNLIQITLILGLIGLFTTVKSKKKVLRLDYTIMLISIFVVWLLSIDGILSRIEGFTLVSAYIYYIYYLSKKEEVIKKANHNGGLDIFSFFELLLGLGVLLFSTNVVINNAVLLSTIWKVSGSLIGAVMIGVATALPELTTAIRGIIKGASNISLGTLIGSNITNPLFALGLGALISGYKIESTIIWFDIPFWFFSSLIVLFFFGNDFKLGKKESISIIILYLVYLILRIRLF